MWVWCWRWKAGGRRWEAGDGRWEAGGGRRAAGAGSWELEAGSWELGAGSWKVRRCDVARWKVEGGRLKAGIKYRARHWLWLCYSSHSSSGGHARSSRVLVCPGRRAWDCIPLRAVRDAARSVSSPGLHTGANPSPKPPWRVPWVGSAGMVWCCTGWEM